MFGDQEVIPFAEAMENFGKVIDALTLPKRRKLFETFARLEIHIRQSAALLSMLRGYFLESMGAEAEQSPFVQDIDRLVPRPPAAGKE